MNCFFKSLFILLVVSCSSNQVSDFDSGDANNLSPETKALYNNLKLISQDYILFGHQDDVAYGVGWRNGGFKSDVEMVCGDFPAVFGWDIGHIDDTMNIDSVPFTKMKSLIVEVFERGGINTMGWHENNLATNGSSWDNTRVVDKLLPGGSLHSSFISQLDKVYDFVNSLETKKEIKVPIIFRPFHEHNGGWFWWGSKSCSDEEYKQLWQFTHNYLTKEKRLNNILFCYSTDAFTGKDEYLARYPGDEYVDIFGFDDYKSVATEASRQVLIDRLQVVNTLAKERDKVAVLSETGYETLSLNNWFTDVLLAGIKAAPETDRIAYVLVWRNARESHHYAPYPGHASTENFIKFKNDSITLFLSDMHNMYQ